MYCVGRKYSKRTVQNGEMSYHTIVNYSKLEFIQYNSSITATLGTKKMAVTEGWSNIEMGRTKCYYNKKN